MSARRSGTREIFAPLLIFLLTATALPQTPPTATQRLTITITDENNVAVSGARVLLQLSPQMPTLRCETGFYGRCNLSALLIGTYQLRVEKEGFYTALLSSVQVGAVADLDVTLHHLQEIREVVNVVESPPAIDPAQTSSTQRLSGLDIINIPFPTTRDYRNALNFIPEVVQDVRPAPHCRRRNLPDPDLAGWF